MLAKLAWHHPQGIVSKHVYIVGKEPEEVRRKGMRIVKARRSGTRTTS
jgi:hypothetical protein